MEEFSMGSYNNILDDDTSSQEDVVEFNQDFVNPDSLVADDNVQETEQNHDGSNNSDNDSNNDSNNDEDVLTSYLKSYGIKDPSKIAFENEDGETEEKDWSSLSKEEQLTMLQELSNSDYNDYERSVIDYLRKNNTDLQGVIDYFSKKAVEDYLTENPDKRHQKEYTIDDYTDDELYISDMKLKYPDFTDEELNERLDSAKANEELFKKEVDALRAYYKEQEDLQEEQAKANAQAEYEALQNSLLTAASRFTEIKFDMEDAEDPGGFEIEDNDRQKALAYLLAVDKDGQSQFDKDLSDPNALFEIAYLRTSARDLLTGTSQYYKKVIAETRKELAKTKKALEKYEKKGNNTTVVKHNQEENKEDKTGKYVWI